MTDEAGAVAIGEFARLKPNIYFSLVNDNSEHKKSKSMNKNIVARISHNDYKDVLLINKCLRHWMNRIQSKDQRMKTY